MSNNNNTKRKQSVVSPGELELWNRIIGKRRQEWTLLPRTVLVAIIRPFAETLSQTEDPWQQTEFLLTSHFNKAVDRSISPKKRRAAWHSVNALLKSLDQEGSSLQHSKTQKNDAGALPQKTNAASVAPSQQKSNNSSAPPVQDKKAAASSVVNQSSSLTAAKKSAADSQKTAALVQQHQQQQHASSTKNKTVAAKATGAAAAKAPSRRPQQEQPVALSNKPATNNTASAVARLATPTPPTSTTTTTVVQRPSSTQNIGNSMGSAFSSTAKVAPVSTTAPTTKKTAVTKKTRPVSISFCADTNRFAAAIDKSGRSSLRVTFVPQAISGQESQRSLQRLAKWDPYWQVEHVVDVKETSTLQKVENLKTGTRPQQAMECTIQLNGKEASRIQQWGKPLERSHKYQQGDVRLLVRMLPAQLQSGGKKRPRADTHLWPKGTFVQLSGLPVAIDQRRQQQHDAREWKSMSTPLDLSGKLAYPCSVNKMQLYFLDKEKYVMVVAVCSYKSPDAVLNTLVSSQKWRDQQQLSMQQAKKKALENAKRQTVVLDEDDDTSSSNDLSSFIFPLTCPVSQQLLKTPVRGKHCNHWQCFDLRNFVETNSHVTGTRWECPVCSKILSLDDLEYCPLTDSILKECQGMATPHRDRVQFFADGTWKLLDEAKKRYGKKRAAVDGDSSSVSGSKRARMDGAMARTATSPEVIDLL